MDYCHNTVFNIIQFLKCEVIFVSFIILFQGWMNETHSYDPESFHPSVTHTVYVTLKGSQLHLAHPRASVPRSAAFDEEQHEAVFSHSRTYELANCKVSVSAKQSNLWFPGEHAPLIELKEKGKMTSRLNSCLSSVSTHFVT